MSTLNTTPEHSPLGKSVQYQDQYDPSLLFPILRQSKRDEIGVLADKLPFIGVDLWTGYELSWLGPKGKPEVAIVYFVLPATSPCLIESKSFKLYLNSFNQTKLDSVETVRALLTQDLSKAAGAPVEVDIHLPALWSTEKIVDLGGTCIDDLDIEIDHYQPNIPALKSDASVLVEETLSSHLLKSNCLVTGQPDWGCVQICYKGPKIDREGLLRYLIGFRQHNEFHEQCVERIYVDIMQNCQPTELTVYARYTRRGGLDINPWRSNVEPRPTHTSRTSRQ